MYHHISHLSYAFLVMIHLRSRVAGLILQYVIGNPVYPQRIPGKSSGYELPDEATTMRMQFAFCAACFAHCALPSEYPGRGSVGLVWPHRPSTRHFHRHIIRIRNLKYDTVSTDKSNTPRRMNIYADKLWCILIQEHTHMHHTSNSHLIMLGTRHCVPRHIIQ